LNTLEFNGARKRMSVIVRAPNGKIYLYCKGADTIIYQRLASNDERATKYTDVTQKHLDAYAADGLRTLCLAYRELPEDVYKDWAEQYHQASVSIGNREAEVDRVCELIERDLILLGATAIEDRLQDAVPETIHDLARANIKIWMLTGDKQQTAVNIGYACQLFTRTMKIHVLEGDSVASVRDYIRDLYQDIVTCEKNQKAESVEEKQEFGLVVESSTLDLALDPENHQDFVRLATKCKAVVCCRCTPLQKARVVALVREKLGSTTLAIGDGANDVSMIQAAHVGIGISGEEGLQAARSADYSISQFMFLKKLLLIHGRYSYRRLGYMILYTFYKNVLFFMLQFWYVFINGYSGQSLFDRWTLAMTNVVFTGLPIVVFGIFDKDISEKTVYKFPSLYCLGQNNEVITMRTFIGWSLNGLYQSGLVFLMVYLITRHCAVWSNGYNIDLYAFGHTMYTICMVIVTMRIALDTYYWTWVVHLIYWGCLGVYILWAFIYGIFWYTKTTLGETYFMLAEISSMSATLWLSLLVVPVICLTRDIVWKHGQRVFAPRQVHIAQEYERKQRRLPSKSKQVPLETFS